MILTLPFNNKKKHKNIYFICISSVILSILIWFIFLSQPYKIYRNNKIQPIQYLLY